MSSIIGNSVPRIQPKRRSAAIEPAEPTDTPHELRIASPFFCKPTSYTRATAKVAMKSPC